MLLIFYYLCIFCLGAAIGSFLNVWVWRTRENLSVARGRSLCPNCRVTIAWYDNIPLLSYLFLRGRCRHCQYYISCQYPLVELWTGLAAVVAAIVYTSTPFHADLRLVRDWIIIFFLTFVFLYDMRYKEIFTHHTVYPGVGIFIVSLITGWNTWQSMTLGVLFGAGFFLFQYVVSKGKWIGGGDVRLGFFMGIILGWPDILVALFLAYILGALVSVILLIQHKKQLSSETPFGTYLVIGTFVAMYWAPTIIEWYVRILS